MNGISPVVKGHEAEELVWGTEETLKRGLGVHALHVNPNDGCDTIVLRFKLSWFEKIKVLFGQDLFVWMGTYTRGVQWPMLFFNDPVKLQDGQFLPFEPELWRAMQKRSWQEGIAVPSRAADGSSSTAMHPDLDAEMHKTVKEKLGER